jgi:hypothetical protein
MSAAVLLSRAALLAEDFWKDLSVRTRDLMEPRPNKSRWDISILALVLTMLPSFHDCAPIHALPPSVWNHRYITVNRTHTAIFVVTVSACSAGFGGAPVLDFVGADVRLWTCFEKVGVFASRLLTLHK